MKKRLASLVAVLFFGFIGTHGLWAEQVPYPTPDEDPQGDTGALVKAQIVTGGSYDIHSGNATRIVNDLHVPGALGAYGLDFTRYWNSLHPEDTNEDAEWPLDFGVSGWSHSWRWTAVYGEVLPNLEPPVSAPMTWITSVTINFPDGHATKFKIARTNGSGGDGRAGPPYSHPGETDWPRLAGHVHDRLVSMALDGHEFWLSRADGGSVHFLGIDSRNVDGHLWWYYEAKEVFDPHGLKTNLCYDQRGNLHEVKQDGGRSLVINWGDVGLAAPVIASVDSKGESGQQLQHVSYSYSLCGPVLKGLYVLASVTYPDEPAPAIYTYGLTYGDTPNNDTITFPLLKTADDPHFAGAMTKISYRYWGDYCPERNFPPAIPPPGYYDWFYFTRETIIEERSMNHTIVSRFAPECKTGSRKDYNGIGGWRWFFFGKSAGDQTINSSFGYELTKGTDFGPSQQNLTGVPNRKQTETEPGRAWDGRQIETDRSYSDDSGKPSFIRYADHASCTYDRVHPSPLSAEQDLGRIHNQQHHWLFSQTDELTKTTVYTRDQRRRVTRVDYPGGSSETLVYDNSSYYNPNGLNQLTSRTLPSGAIETYEYDPATHLLMREYNSVDGWAARREYEYDSLGRVSKMTDGRARISLAPFTVMLSYNGRHQVISEAYPGTGDAPYPAIHYEYDVHGNCTAIIDELGHRREYTYDPYRRCISHTEQVNACGVASRTWNWIYDRVIDNGATFPACAHTSKEWRVQIEPAFNALGERRVTARTFDVNNRMTSEQTGVIQPPTPGSSWYNGPDVETHHFTYDENGQKKTYQDPLGRLTTYGYDIRNRLETTTEPKRTSQPVNPVTRFHYDAAGNKLTVTFPDTQTQQWDDYDAFGQAWKFTDERHNPTDLVYWWGPMKKLHQVTTHREAGGEDQPTTFSYDLMGRPTQTLFPDRSDEFSSYEFGQLSTWKTRRNQLKHIHYDARGREDYHTWDHGAAPGINRVWDAANRLTTIWNSVSTIDYTYDDAGQVRTEGTTVAGSNGNAPAGSGLRNQLSYCRLPNGEVSHVTYPDGSFTVNLDYTARGQLAGVGWPGGSTSYAYLPDGKVSGQFRTNNVTTTYGYDGRGIISSMSHRKNGDTHDLAFREYWRDDRDRITAWRRGSDNVRNGMEDGRGDRYGYDAEGQLTAASYRAFIDPETQIPSGALRVDNFQYDAMGNRMDTNYLADRGPIISRGETIN